MRKCGGGGGGFRVFFWKGGERGKRKGTRGRLQFRVTNFRDSLNATNLQHRHSNTKNGKKRPLLTFRNPGKKSLPTVGPDFSGISYPADGNPLRPCSGQDRARVSKTEFILATRRGGSLTSSPLRERVRKKRTSRPKRKNTFSAETRGKFSFFIIPVKESFTSDEVHSLHPVIQQRRGTTQAGGSLFP